MQLKIITVKSPEDILYPCEKTLFDDPQVIYHGTSSVYASSIERDGWIPNAVPYSIQDIQIICNIYESLAFFGTSGKGYPVLKACTLGNGAYTQHKSASFSESYWRARVYAARPGGETLDNIIFALKDLELLLRNTEQLKVHKRTLQSQFDQRKRLSNHEVLEYQSAIQKMGAGDYVSKCLQQATALKHKYLDTLNRHQPVVYCVRIEPGFFEMLGGKEWLATIGVNRERFEGAIEIRPKRNVSVSPEFIELRIDFPKGISWWLPFYGDSLPLPWSTTPEQIKQMWEKHGRTFGPEAD